MTQRAQVVPWQGERKAEALSSAMTATTRHEQASPSTDARQAQGTNGIDITIAAGATADIYHQLGRTPKGWRLLDLYATATVGAAIRRTAWDKDTITLANDSATNVTLRVEVF